MLFNGITIDNFAKHSFVISFNLIADSYYRCYVSVRWNSRKWNSDKWPLLLQKVRRSVKDSELYQRNRQYVAIMLLGRQHSLASFLMNNTFGKGERDLFTFSTLFIGAVNKECILKSFRFLPRGQTTKCERQVLMRFRYQITVRCYPLSLVLPKINDA